MTGKETSPGAGNTEAPKADQDGEGHNTSASDQGTENNSVRLEARYHLQRKRQPIRLKPRSKKPALDSHDASTITWSNVSELTANDNIGIRFAKDDKTKDHKTKDIDYDFKSSADLAKEVGLVDATASFGRQSFGVTHSLYSSPGCAAKKFELPESNKYPKALPLKEGQPSLMVLEIRGSDNTYTMVPPSVHPDTGERLEWCGSKRDPLEVKPEDLRALAGLHAVASVVLYFYPENAATRYEVRMALAGALIRSEVSAERVTRYVRAVASLGRDPKWDEDFVDHTEQRLKDDKPVSGIPKLVEVLQLPEACERTFREWLMADGDASQALDPQDPMRSARQLIARNYVTDEKRTLHRHRGAFWLWTGSYYLLADDEVIQAAIWEFLEKSKKRIKDKESGEWLSVPFKPNRSKVGDMVAALGAVCQLDKYIAPPAWLSQSGMPPASEFLACGNGLLHLPTGTLHQPSPSYFNLSASEVVFDPAAQEPSQWLAFLRELFDDDQQAVELLQDWFGYSISPDTSQQKILLAVGPKRSGKGTIARIKSMLLGRDSVAGPTMSSLSDRFGLEPLITKPLAIVSDARIGKHSDKSTIVERLLSISGEDQMTVDRKFKEAWHGRLMTRFMILTNELPSLTDGSGALAGRFLVLILIKSFFGKEDPALTNKLAAELSGILNWSIVGYRRLRDRGHFIQPKSSEEAINDIEMLAAPVKAFIRDICETGPGLTVKVDELWGQWKEWCSWEGQRDAGTKSWFGRNLRSAQPGLVVIYPVDEKGLRVPTYVGIRVKPGAEVPV